MQNKVSRYGSNDTFCNTNSTYDIKHQRMRTERRILWNIFIKIKLEQNFYSSVENANSEINQMKSIIYYLSQTV
jgi:hypothetical protein